MVFIGLLLLAALLLTANWVQFGNSVSNNRVIHRLDSNLLSELDSLRLELAHHPTPSILAVEQASKIAALSTFSTLEFDYGYTLESALKEDPANKQLQREFDLLLVK